MKYRKLKSINKEVSEIGIGLWSLVSYEWGGVVNNEEILTYAYEKGINFFDTADIYGKGEGERLLGNVFKNNREEIVILTKIGYDLKTNRRRFDLNYLKDAIDNSLNRLNTSYIDILMLHNPTMEIIKNNEIFEFMNDLKEEGKILSYGISLGPTLGWEEEGYKSIEMGYHSLEHIYNIIERYPGEKFLRFNNIDHFIRVPHASDVLNDMKWPLKFDSKLHRKFKDMKWIEEALKGAEILQKKINRFKLHEIAILYVLSNKNVSSVLPNITSKDEIDIYSRIIDNNMELNENELQTIDDVYNTYFKKLNEESIDETKMYK
ncbi:putative oxidoreductase, aryl-alcohol dehydrogenase like protein [Caldisphaera lagunensis DSM 15908]|uniref:Putative oxidoreductase, aryl-alcohol dehydrogenase like protein n=1 Tax=Caldisphaera lagunensis (strain DSM 15908 / JCM 11604 / ANMR 0165 / IC-154) TaxID=1056495 RepID=L0A9Q7_CALLD|nr:aldo/keto reductase [Caldisphaera lagunensis]AFZ70591.1 putative oxidoreductase, aryl-alcohol dehydrogenase like protein [Caldisphaera lagunensis DSM 15908]